MDRKELRTAKQGKTTAAGSIVQEYIKNNHYFSSDDNFDIRRWQYLYKLGELAK